MAPHPLPHTACTSSGVYPGRDPGPSSGYQRLARSHSPGTHCGSCRQSLHTNPPVCGRHSQHGTSSGPGSWHGCLMGNFARWRYDFEGLVYERRNSSALAMELRLSCINPSIRRRFPHYWLFWREWIPLKKGQDSGALCFFIVDMNKHSNIRVTGDIFKRQPQDLITTCYIRVCRIFKKRKLSSSRWDLNNMHHLNDDKW